MTVPAWDVLAVLPAGQAAELLRQMLRDGDENADGLAAEELEVRMSALAPVHGEDSP